MDLFLDNEQATLEAGQQLAHVCNGQDLVIFLSGDLGAGKTTFSRGFLTALGHTGKVKSPTYTLVEQYEFDNFSVYHFDLYRLSDPEELDYIGLDDYIKSNSICLIEWPEKGSNYLPTPDIFLRFSHQNYARNLTITAQSQTGENLLKKLNK